MKRDTIPSPPPDFSAEDTWDPVVIDIAGFLAEDDDEELID